MLRSPLFWQLAGSCAVLVLLTAALPPLTGPGWAAVGVLSALLLVLLLVGWKVQQVRDLGNAVATLAQEKDDASASWASDEIARLARALEHLVRQQRELQVQVPQESRSSSSGNQEEASRVRSDLLAILSHEIRTPLNGILGMTQLALQTPLSAEQREYLDIAQSSADFLLSVLNQLQDFSEIEAGSLRLESVRFSLSDALADTLKMLGFRAQQKGLELMFEAAADVPDLLQGDPDRLRLLLVNLVGNAVNFTERGEVLVQVARMQDPPGAAEGSPQLSSTDPARPPFRLHFQVKDTGIGISPEKQALLFEAFPPPGRPPVHWQGGGLGLALARQLVERMDGKLWVESSPGQGSTFHFTAAFEAGLEAAPPAPAVSPAPGVQVLVVDDNATSARIIAGRLRSWELEATEAASAAAALEVLERATGRGAPFGLAIIDAHMPEVDGFELVAQMRERPVLGNVPIVMLIGSHRPDDAARARKLGVAAHLMKPWHPGELLAVLRMVLTVPGPDAPGPGQLPSLAGPKGQRVLVAEGNPANRQLAKVLLEKLGHQVSMAATGQEVLRLLDQRPIDIVLLDVGLPEGDAFETTAAIRAREQATGGRPAIIVTIPFGLTAERERCLSAGMDSAVTKPLQMKELAQAIQSVRR
jgi:signal transduction histidine kinase/DNA-binding response OmpR family regulator